GERRVVSVILARGLAAADVTATLSAQHGTRFDCLADGSLLAMFAGPNAVDQAERASSVATALAATFDEARIAVATGMSELHDGTPLGEAIDRAAALLDHPRAPDDHVHLDQITTRLIEARASTGTSRHAGEPAFVGRTRE